MKNTAARWLPRWWSRPRENIELDFTAIFRQCLKDNDDRLAQLGIEGLWEQEDRWLVAELVELLRSERGPLVRAAAALALGKFPVLAQEGKLPPQEEELVYRVLMDFLEDEIEDLEVRRRCLEAVAPFNTEEVQDYIRWAFDGDDQDLRSSSIYAMGRTGAAGWLPTLLREMESFDAAVRYETAHACGELGRAGGHAATDRVAGRRRPRGAPGQHRRSR